MIETGSVKAARARVSEVLESARYVDLSRIIIGRAAPETEHAREVATDAAKAAGRSAVVEEARAAAGDWVLEAFARRGYTGTWAATEVAMSVARPADRVEVADALADAVTAAAVEDLVDADTLDALRSRWGVVAEASSIPEPGTLDQLTRSIGGPAARARGNQAYLAAALLLLAGALLLGIHFMIPGFALVLAGLVVLGTAIRDRWS